MNQLLVALRFYATGSFQLVVGDTVNIENGTVCRTLHRVTRAIASLRNRYVVSAETDQMKAERDATVVRVDCTHVLIQSPGGDDAEIYRTRKGYFSLNIQLISDCDNFIRDVVAWWPGSVHDSSVFDNSHVREMFQTGRHRSETVGMLAGRIC